MFAAATNRLLSRFHAEKDYRECILRSLPARSVCAELGVYKGDFSELILKATEPKKLHLIDPWKFEVDPAYEGSWYGGPTGRSQANMDAIHDSVLFRFHSAMKSGVVEVNRQTSADCCASFPDGYFDWIYVDGNHQYNFVKQDLEMYLPKVKTSGLIAGDDYGNAGWWQDGVTKAVDEAVASGRLEKVRIENHQFLLRRM